jgi:hypothetical protein
VLFLIFRRTLPNLVLLTPHGDDLLSFVAIVILNHFHMVCLVATSTQLARHHPSH